jgi:SAM-dependent methyltransferase
MDFRDYLRKKVLKKNDRILEFGPLNWPIVQKSQFKNAFYADVRATSEIKELYTSNEYLESTGIKIDVDSIVDIDFVISDTYAKTFKGKEKFDAIVLSHVIEHIPDIINFFEDVKTILKKDGKLIILYPDARYCFDAFRNGSTFIDAYEVYRNKELLGARVFDFTYNVVGENRPSFFWQNKELASILPKNTFAHATETYSNAIKGTMPDDVHFWPFSDYQFVKFLYDMDRAKLLGLDVLNFWETKPNTQEFMIILELKKKPGVRESTYKKILSDIHPNIRFALLRESYESLKGELGDKTDRLNAMEAELSEIKRSKKWRYSMRLAGLMHPRRNTR